MNNTTTNTAENALQNLVNAAISSGRATAGNVEARVYGNRVRLFINNERVNKNRALTEILEIVEPVFPTSEPIEIDKPAITNIRHAQNLFDNERARSLFYEDAQQIINNHPNGVTAWSLHRIMTTVFGWEGFTQKSPELSANLFNFLTQETGLLTFEPIQRKSRTVYAARLA